MSSEAIDQMLQEAGVDIGQPDRRHKRASRLLSEGLAPAALEELIAWGHKIRRKPHRVGHWVGWATSSAERWRAVLTDLQKMREAEARRAPAPVAPERMPLDHRPRTPEEDAQRRQELAFVRVIADRAPRERVADEMGLTTTQLNELIDAESRKRGVELNAPAKRGTKDDTEVW